MQQEQETQRIYREMRVAQRQEQERQAQAFRDQRAAQQAAKKS